MVNTNIGGKKVKKTIMLFGELFTRRFQKSKNNIQEIDQQIKNINEHVKDLSKNCYDGFPSASTLIIDFNIDSLINEFNLYRAITTYTYADVISFLDMKKRLENMDILNTKSFLKNDIEMLYSLLNKVKQAHTAEELDNVLKDTSYNLHFLQRIYFQLILNLREISKNYSKSREFNLKRYCEVMEEYLKELSLLIKEN